MREDIFQRWASKKRDNFATISVLSIVVPNFAFKNVSKLLYKIEIVFQGFMMNYLAAD